MKIVKNPIAQLSRRQLLGLGLAAALPGFSPPAAAQSQNPRRLFSIFLRGGWDSHLGSDPVLGSRLSSGNFAGAYASLATAAVSGKPQLVLGAGLLPMVDVLAEVPTAFVNGIFVEVSAHEIAYNYMMSTRLSLSRSREFPCLAALLASAQSSYPPHVVLGASLPLGETRASHPPLQASSIDQIAQLLRGPGRAAWNKLKPETLGRSHALLEALDQLAAARLSPAQASALAPWNSAQAGLTGLYGRDLGAALELSETIKNRYGIGEPWQLEGQIAGAFLALSKGVSPYVTVIPQGNFDTHSSHFSLQKPLLERTARVIAKILSDMRVTPDPDRPDLKLIETTTVMISSEFVRTPQLNAAQGTDHWQSASAILIGAGVEDGQVLGATGQDAMPLGWQNGAPTGLNQETALRPEYLGAALLQSMGRPELALTISDRPLRGLLKGV